MNDVRDTNARNASVPRPRFRPPRPGAGRRRSASAACLLAAGLLALLAACGQSPGITLTLAPTGAEVVRGADTQVEVALIRRGGVTDDVALSVTGLPANVTATFSPDNLSGAALTSTLTITAAASAVAGTYDLVVHGSGAGLSTSAGLTLEVLDLTVTGRVVTFVDGPVIGASVRAQGDSAVTDDTGAFTLTGLSVPYDLSVWNTAEEWVHVYEQLTSADVLLAPVGTDLAASPMTATVSGNLTGDAIPVPTSQRVMVCASSDDASCSVATPSCRPETRTRSASTGTGKRLVM